VKNPTLEFFCKLCYYIIFNPQIRIIAMAKHSYDDLSTRMKKYEAASGGILVPRMPAIIRLDGKAFHTFTRRRCDRSVAYDPIMHDVMCHTMLGLTRTIQNVKFGYTQSDEISLLLIDYTSHTSSQWFDGKIQKIVSVAAAAATANFTYWWNLLHPDDQLSLCDLPMFDARVFTVPESDVCNAFIWRQQDAMRNAVQIIGRHHYSHTEMHGKSCKIIRECLQRDHNIEWQRDVPTWQRHGTAMCRQPGGWAVDLSMPMISQNRHYVEQYIPGINLKSSDDTTNNSI
jgi:tRNA(His) 5'-end guanylyltransferase